MSELPDGPKKIPKIKYLPENGARKFSLNHDQEKLLFDEVAKLDLDLEAPRVGRKRKPDGLIHLRLYLAF